MEQSIQVWILLEVTFFMNATLTTFLNFDIFFWVGATAKQQQTHQKVMTE